MWIVALTLLDTELNGIRGRPKFCIPREQLEYFIEYGFKATDIFKMLCVCNKTVYRRLEDYGISMRMISAGLKHRSQVRSQVTDQVTGQVTGQVNRKNIFLPRN